MKAPQDQPESEDRNGGEASTSPSGLATSSLPSSSPHLAEVIAADSLSFEAECRRLYGAPAFGSFVCVEGAERQIFGVVAHVSTGTTDPGRRTQALHLTPGQLAGRMPQLELVLRTCFTTLILGYQEGRQIYPHLPPAPPEIHRFVHSSAPDEIERLTAELDFLEVLAGASLVPAEELMAAAVLHAAAARGSGALADRFLVECGQAIVALFRREPERFHRIMRRLASSRRPAVAWEQPLELR